VRQRNSNFAERRRQRGDETEVETERIFRRIKGEGKAGKTEGRRRRAEEREERQKDGRRTCLLAARDCGGTKCCGFGEKTASRWRGERRTNRSFVVPCGRLRSCVRSFSRSLHQSPAIARKKKKEEEGRRRNEEEEERRRRRSFPPKYSFYFILLLRI
jgi:hypothetical protein